MFNLIYVDSEGTIRTHSNINKSEFDLFKSSLNDSCILFNNGTVFGGNVPEKDREIFPAILKSFMKQWSTNQQLLAPEQPKPFFVADESKTDTRNDGLDEVKVKKTRKKKVNKNAN